MSPFFNIRRTTARPSALSYFVVRAIATAVLASIAFIAAPNLLAQSDDSQQTNQDVAEAARRARASKQQNAARAHVYTNEDLRRGKILTPEDQSRAEAANHKNSSTPDPAAPPNVQALDANSATPHAATAMPKRFRRSTCPRINPRSPRRKSLRRWWSPSPIPRCNRIQEISSPLDPFRHFRMHSFPAHLRCHRLLRAASTLLSVVAQNQRPRQL